MSLLRSAALFSSPLAFARVSQRASFGTINKLTLVGTVGRDPEMKTFDNGNSLVNFSVATHETIRGQEETIWHQIDVNSSKTGQFVMDYIRKGDGVYIDGKLKLRKYVNRDGVEVERYSVKASEVQKVSTSQKNREANESTEAVN